MFLFTNLCFLSEGLFGQHNMKKRKMMRQSLDNSFDNLTPMAGSIPSPVASQMSNMSNPNKLIKILGVRDRGRKSKSFKVLRRLTLILNYIPFLVALALLVYTWSFQDFMVLL